MNVSSCPRCHDPIRIPESGLTSTSHAQCPWCGDEFPLDEVLKQLPPMLKILSDDGMPVTGAPYDPASGTAIAPEPVEDFSPESDAESFGVQGDQTDVVETTAFDGETMIDDAKSNDSSFSEALIASPSATPARRQNRSGGGLRWMLGIVVGGLLAFPIAGGILWGIGKGLGYGPFADSGAISSNRMASKPVELSGAKNQNATTQPLTPATETLAPEAETLAPEAETLAPEAETLAPEAETLAPAVSNQVDRDVAEHTEDDSAEAGLTLPELDDVSMSSDKPATQPPDNQIEVIDLNVSESPELVAKVSKAKDMIDAIKKFTPVGDKRTTWLTTAYRTIAEASELATGGGPSIQRLAESVRKSGVLDEFEVAGSDWMDASNRSNDGIMIVGTLEDRTVTLQSGNKVPIVSESPLPSSDRVMVLGRISGDGVVNAIWVESL